MRNYIIIGLSAGLFLGIFVIQISRDVSIDYNVWLKNLFSVNYERNDYVLINAKYLSNRSLIKQIVCADGDYLERFDDSFYCNKVKVATAFTYDKFGNILPAFNYNGVIPSGLYFVAGTHERSYDSRYFGLVKYSDIKLKLYPLF